MYRPGGMSSEDDSDWDDNYYSHSTPLANKNIEISDHSFQETLEEQLVNAVAARDLDKVKDLLSQGADVDYTPENNWNSIIQASSYGCYEIIKLLIEKGADVNSSYEKFTPLLAICSSTSRSEEDLLRCLDLLITSGAKINVSDWYRVSALSHSVRQGHERIALKLIDEGADIDATDQDGWSPIFFAVNSGKSNCVSLLINSGANIYAADRQGRSLLDIALDKEDADIIKLLSGGLESDNWIVSLDDSNEQNIYKRLISALPNSKDRFSGFRQDVFNILNAVELTHLNKFLYVRDIGLGHLLTADDATLKNIGIQFWFERRKILKTVERFHEYPWSMSSFGSIVSCKEFDVFQIAQLMSILTRQLYLISISTYWWGKQGGIQPQIKTLPDNLKESLKTIRILRGKVTLLQSTFRKIDREECIIPSDLILPPSSSAPGKGIFKVIMPAVFLLFAIFISKKKVLSSLYS